MSHAVLIELRCQWCGRAFKWPERARGPKPKFCKQSHRQRAYELRKLAGLTKSDETEAV